jgi:predicted nucleotidyltransferase
VNVKAFLDKFSQWASAQPNIEAVALVGSWARESADEESDVDLIILTTQPENYINDSSWSVLFGGVTECKVEDWGRCKSLRVFYKDNLEVEYGFALPEWADIPVDPGTHRVVSNGMKSLFDPKGVLAKLQKEVFATWRRGEK